MKTHVAWLGLVLLCACHEEPTIVIKFEPNDLSTAATATSRKPTAPAVSDGGARPHDAGSRAVDKAPISAAPECAHTADCVVVPEECCDCANGGQQHAVPKARARALRAEQMKKCKGIMCTMMLSTDPT